MKGIVITTFYVILSSIEHDFANGENFKNITLVKWINENKRGIIAMSYCEQMFKYGLGGEDWHKFEKEDSFGLSIGYYFAVQKMTLRFKYYK